MDYEKKYKDANDKVAARFGTNVAKEIFTDLYESEDEKVISTIKKALEAKIEDLGNGVTKTACLAWLEKQGGQKPAWSEEDEKTLNEIFSVAARASLRKSTLFGKSYDYIKWQNWLKSLRPQPKQEWSEEDNWIKTKIIKVLLGCETFLTSEETNECIDWIKSIKQRLKGKS